MTSLPPNILKILYASKQKSTFILTYAGVGSFNNMKINLKTHMLGTTTLQK